MRAARSCASASIRSGTAPSADTNASRLVQRRRRRGRRENPGTAGEEIGTRCPMPPARRSGERMAADEAADWRAGPAPAKDLALRAADVGDDRRPADDVARSRSSTSRFCRTGAASTIRSASATMPRSSAPTSAACSAHRRFEHVLAVDARMQTPASGAGWPSPATPPIRPKPTMAIRSNGGGSALEEAFMTVSGWATEARSYLKKRARASGSERATRLGARRRSRARESV